ncbi:hypothetical protein VTK73DRAFT_3974 [Phialemonium thermophilum]|uniref:Uncharacterized protein n=1 Tax=Phialemonium thermophilum TaxID=223376 RepID=A0ABR3WWJ8_9PEZI
MAGGGVDTAKRLNCLRRRNPKVQGDQRSVLRAVICFFVEVRLIDRLSHYLCSIGKYCPGPATDASRIGSLSVGRVKGVQKRHNHTAQIQDRR